MKKTKVYRPRRGMRFSNGRKGVSPPAGFIGGEPISRTRPFPEDSALGDSGKSLVGDDDHLVKPGGAVMGSLTSPERSYEPFSPAVTTSSLSIQGSISMGRLYERGKLNSSLITPGSSRRILPGGPVWPSVSTMDVTNEIPGNLTSSSPPPSWTRAYMGQNQAFVINALSSSNQENVTFNTFVSGIEYVENSSVPAFNVIHASKEQRFKTIIVKKTASFFDTVPSQYNSSSNGGTFLPGKTFVSGKGLLVSEVNNASLPSNSTGSRKNCPVAIPIEVPVSGRLTNINVWVELHHESSSLSGRFTPLGCLCLALRSPNVKWGWAHPFENAKILTQVQAGPPEDDESRAGRSYTNAEIYRDSFLLWEGQGSFFEGQGLFDGTNFVSPSNPFEITVPLTNGNHDWRRRNSCWDRDLSMRVVFSDGSSNKNPRHNTFANMSGNHVGSPNSSLGINSAWGMGVSWTGSTGSPPAGWLTGPGGVAAVNEWPTTGSNRGVESIRPVYPLVDPIIQRISLNEQVPTTIQDYYTNFQLVNYLNEVGSRPGLYGTEISGVWTLLISAGNSWESAFPSGSFPLWFKQARIEITYETGIGSQFLIGGKNESPGLKIISSLSGVFSLIPILTASAHTIVNFPNENSFARSFGIGNSNESALQYRLSGSIADISGAIPGWLFTGPFGMPIIPESSASLVVRTVSSITTASFMPFLQPRRDLDLSQNIIDVASDVNPKVRLRDLATQFVSASST